jgi:hypothetical protein
VGICQVVNNLFLDVQDDLGASQRKGIVSIVPVAGEGGAAARGARLAVDASDGAVVGLVGADDVGKVRVSSSCSSMAVCLNSVFHRLLLAQG